MIQVRNQATDTRTFGWRVEEWYKGRGKKFMTGFYLVGCLLDE